MTFASASQPGEGHSRSHLRDYEPLSGPSFEALLGSILHSAAGLHLPHPARPGFVGLTSSTASTIRNSFLWKYPLSTIYEDTTHIRQCHDMDCDSWVNNVLEIRLK